MTAKKTKHASTVPVYCSHSDIVDIEKLVPNPRNPNKHGDKQIALLAKIIRNQGWRNPIVISNRSGFIVKGHGRLEAARLLNVSQVPIDQQDYDSEAAEYADLIADNRIAELAEIDDSAIKGLLEDAMFSDFDMDLTGFDSDELGKIGVGEFVTEGLTDEDEVPDPPEKAKSRRGQVWALGEHRLMCGDSTSKDDVEKLMGENKADMVFTDPPYGVNYSGRGQNTSNTIENDALSIEDTEKLVFGALSRASDACVDGSTCFVWHADSKPHLRPIFEKAFLESGWRLSATIVWVKKQASMGYQDYRAQHEPCLYGWKGTRKERVSDRTQTTVWESGRDRNYVHPTQKPTILAETAIRNHKPIIVLDLFLGSGSTLIACEKTGRKCYGMEIDGRYCDVIIKRWEDFTGRKAVLVNDG